MKNSIENYSTHTTSNLVNSSEVETSSTVITPPSPRVFCSCKAQDLQLQNVSRAIVTKYTINKPPTIVKSSAVETSRTETTRSTLGVILYFKNANF